MTLKTESTDFSSTVGNRAALGTASHTKANRPLKLQNIFSNYQRSINVEQADLEKLFGASSTTVSASLPENSIFEHDSSLTEPKFQVFSDGHCSTLSFIEVAQRFGRSIQSASKPERAFELFAKVASAINLLGKPAQLYKGSNLCVGGAGKGMGYKRTFRGLADLHLVESVGHVA